MNSQIPKTQKPKAQNPKPNNPKCVKKTYLENLKTKTNI